MSPENSLLIIVNDSPEMAEVFILVPALLASTFHIVIVSN